MLGVPVGISMSSIKAFQAIEKIANSLKTIRNTNSNSKVILENLFIWLNQQEARVKRNDRVKRPVIGRFIFYFTAVSFFGAVVYTLFSRHFWKSLPFDWPN